MSKIKFFLSLGLLISGFNIYCQKNYVLQETNIDKGKAAQFINAAKKVENVLLKNSPQSVLTYSDKSTLTNNSINNLIDRFQGAYPKSKPSSYTDRIIERMLLREKPNTVRLTYCTLPQGQYTTGDFVALTVVFDPGSPKIIDIKVQGKAEMPLVTLTEREINPPVVKKAETPKVVKTQTKTPVKSQTKSTTKSKPKTTAPATKKK